MTNRSIIFFTSNSTWGGSEILWVHVAKTLREKGFKIGACAMYDYEKVKEFIPAKDDFFDLGKRFEYSGLVGKVFQKIIFGEYKTKDKLALWIKSRNPALIVISQGNNVVGYPLMQLCKEQEIPFVTLTHLVQERIWPTLDESLISILRVLYNISKKNYFVSRQNLLLHEKMVGEQFVNTAIAYNPFTRANGDLLYPPVENDIYKIAIVGRVEFFHKGQDLLLDVVKQEKWRNRQVSFSIFGDGPHLPLLARLIKQHNIANVSVREHVNDISAIWKEHHILLMPSRMEGQSIALIEAMHYKRAAIVTRVGGAAELIEEGQSGFIADAATVQSIDDALERAWNHRTDWEQMGVIAKKHIATKQPADPVQYFIDQLQEFL